VATLSIACPTWSTVSGTKACTLGLGSTRTSSKAVSKAVKAFALKEGADGQGPIRRPVDGVLRPNFFDVADQVNPPLGRAFLEDTHKLLVGRQAGWLPNTGLQLERDELGLVLVLCRKDLRKQRQNRLERQRLEFPAMARERCSLCQELHLVAIVLDCDFFDQFTEGRNG
jgi:hypothetical protein